MHLVLVSNRGTGSQPHWSQAVTAAVAAVAAADGMPVRWLCPLDREQSAPAPILGVEITALRGRNAVFRRVVARVDDTAVDVALARALRPLARAAVVHIGFGAPGSVTTLWLAERMGALVLAAVLAREVLCHRGTLVDSAEAQCAQFLDPGRCVRCVCSPWQAGLSPLQGKLARLLRPLGGWSPFPNDGAFQSRADLVLASLQLANVFVASAAERDLLATAGIGARNVEVVQRAAAAELDPDAIADAIGAACGQVTGSR